MRAGYDFRETDPFRKSQTPGALGGGQPPIVSRLQSLGETFRGPVVAVFSKAPGLPRNTEAYLTSVDDMYRNDAHHSQSIEGCRVTPELIECVHTGEWDPERNGADRQGRDAIAARGYRKAFLLVRETVGELIGGESPVALLRNAHRDWCREMFQPGVAAGLMGAASLASYRNEAVLLRGSFHVPPRWEAVRGAMPALFDLQENEPEPSRLGVRVPAVGRAAEFAAAFPAAGLRAVPVTVIAARAENGLDAAPLADEDPAP